MDEYKAIIYALVATVITSSLLFGALELNTPRPSLVRWFKLVLVSAVIANLLCLVLFLITLI